MFRRTAMLLITTRCVLCVSLSFVKPARFIAMFFFRSLFFIEPGEHWIAIYWCGKVTVGRTPQ